MKESKPCLSRGARIFACCALISAGGLACDKSSIENMRKELRDSIGSLSSKKDKNEDRVMPKALKEPDDEDSMLGERRTPAKKPLAADSEEEAEPESEEQEEPPPTELEPAFQDEKPSGSSPADDSDFPDLDADEADDADAPPAGKKEARVEKPGEAETEAGGKSSKKAPPPEAADAIKSCPKKGKVGGASPPAGTEQWCEDKGGVREGPYRKWHKGGTKRVDGNFVKGKPDGVFISYSPDGDKAESREYKEGKLDGLSIKWSTTGEKVFEVTYRDGKRDGPFVTYDRSGRKKNQGFFKQEKKDGVWIVYARTGNPRAKVTWDEGKKSGRTEQFYPGGERKVMASYTKDKLDGPFLAFFKDGKKKTEGMYSAGLKDGVWTQYRRDGEISRQMKFKHGARVESEHHDRSGERPHRGSRRGGQDSHSLESGDDLSFEERYEDTKRRAFKGNRGERRNKNRSRRSENDDLPGPADEDPPSQDGEPWQPM